MELGAVVVVPPVAEQIRHSTEATPALDSVGSQTGPALCSPRAPILGNNVLGLWMERVRALGVEDFWLASGPRDWQALHPRLKGLTQQGIERLLVIKLQSYAEMDLVDLLRFHCESQRLFTDTKDKQGSLGVSLLDQSALFDCIESSPSLSSKPCGAQYQFDGYTKRFLLSQERQDLIHDGLAGFCAMKPGGKQIDNGVWVADDATIDSTARIIAPSYIGARSIIHAGAIVGPFTAIERDCVVDCGTTVVKSSVLPNTYLAPGILVEDSVVNGDCLEHLKWGARVNLAPARLARKISARTPFLRGHLFRASAEGSLDRILSNNAKSSPKDKPSWIRVSL